MFARRFLFRQLPKNYSKGMTTTPISPITDQTQKKSNKENKSEKEDDELPPWFKKTIISMCVMPAIGAGIGAIQGSYNYYSKGGYYYDKTPDIMVTYFFYGVIWPLYIPYGICQGIGYLLAKQPIRIQIQKEEKEE